MVGVTDGEYFSFTPSLTASLPLAPGRAFLARGRLLPRKSQAWPPCSSLLVVQLAALARQAAAPAEATRDRSHREGEPGRRSGSASPGPHRRMRMIVFPLSRSVGLRAATAS